ncbi:Solute carrier family 2, facilitated glucose transporter member 5, partial [Ophiophagus hannah]
MIKRKRDKKLRGEEDVEEEMEELRQEHLAERSQKNMTVWKLLRFRSLRWHVITVVILTAGSRFMPTNAVSDFPEQPRIEWMCCLLFQGSSLESRSSSKCRGAGL